MSNATVSVPQLVISVPQAPECQKGLCGANGAVCWYTPRYTEGIIESAIKSKACTEGQYTVTAPTGNDLSSVRYPEDQYPTVCSFDSEACAETVCDGVQRSRINVTDGKWSCYSDWALAKAAADGKYWFATTNATWACKDTPPMCKDIAGRDVKIVQPSSAVTYTGPRTLVAIASTALALVSMWS